MRAYEARGAERDCLSNAQRKNTGQLNLGIKCKPMVESIQLDSLKGVWSRRSIRWPDGRQDTSTRVFWIQAKPHYADIRIPANRPSFDSVNSLRECDETQRLWLSSQQGFAGEIIQRGEGWLWQREIDFQPPTGKRDIGRLRFKSGDQCILIEEGIDEPYEEIWERIDDATSTHGETFVLRLTKGNGILVAAGDHFILALSESQNVEISHGKREGSFADWLITESTFPWREGNKLFSGNKVTIDWNNRSVTESRNWKIMEPASGELKWIK